MAWWRTPQDRKDDMRNRYLAGESAVKIARHFGLHLTTVLDHLKRMGVAMRPRGDGRGLHRINEYAFDIVTPESAYWVGMLMADGCVVRYGNRATIELGLSEIDADHVAAFRNFLGGTQKIHRHPGNGKSKPHVHYGVRSSKLADALARFGVLPRKSKTAKVIGLEWNRDFWRGVVDGDGYVRWQSSRQGRMPNIGLAGSKDLVIQFQAFCLTLCPHCEAQVGQMHSIWTWRTAGSCALTIIKALYDNCSIALKRKQIIANAIIAESRIAPGGYRNCKGSNQYKRAI